jgi:hypothetical protein
MKTRRFFIMPIVVMVVLGLMFSTAFGQNPLPCSSPAPHECIPNDINYDDDLDGDCNEDDVNRTDDDGDQNEDGTQSLGRARQCHDLVDNDGDGLTDSRDPDCQTGTWVDEDPHPPMCDWEACIDTGGGSRDCSTYTLKYYRSADLLTTNTNITRAIIVVHGRRNKKVTVDDTSINYYEPIFDAANDLGLLNETLIIAPLFDRAEKCPVDASNNCIDGADPVDNPWCGGNADSDGRLCWGGSAPNDYPAGGNASNDGNLRASSFLLVDDMINTLAHLKNVGTFPNLSTIVVTGQSAGGQFTLRYAMAGTAEPDGITMRHVPCNPGELTYLNELRPTEASQETFPNIRYQWDCEPPDGVDEPFDVPGAVGPLADTEAWSTYPVSYEFPSGYLWENANGNEIDCVTNNSFDNWPRGIANVSMGNDYMIDRGVTFNEVLARYTERDVFLLFSIDDNVYINAKEKKECGGVPEDASVLNCEQSLQGHARVERGAFFFKHACCGVGCSNHRFETVCIDDSPADGVCDDPPGSRLGHGRGIYRAAATREAVFFGDIPGPAIQGWASTYGSINWDTAISIQQTHEGGYVVAGNTSSFGAGGDIWVVKLDGEGHVTWEKAYGGEEADHVSALSQTSDGGYVVAGDTESFGAGGKDIWVLKLDANGNVGPTYPGTWQKTYGGSESDGPSSIQQTSPDGGYILAGTTRSFGDDINGDVWLLKLDQYGDVVWQNTYGSPSGGELAADIQQIPGGYIFAGETYSFGAGAPDFWVMKLDTAGGILWERTYGGEYIDSAASITRTGDDGYIVAGQTESFALPTVDYHVWVIKLDGNGNLGQDYPGTWQKTYGTGQRDSFTSIANTGIDCGYVLSGYRNSGLLEPADSWVMRLDGAGNILWQREFGGTDLGRSDVLSDVQQTADGGFIAAGGTDSFGVGDRDAWILKLGATGEVADCSAMEKVGPNFIVDNTSATVTDSTAVVVATAISGVSTTATVSVSEAFRSDVCNPQPMVLLSRTGQNRIYHAGDDGTVQAGVPWPSPRFLDNGDGTVTDMLTGLMWLKDANCAGTIGHHPNETVDGSMDWVPALDFVTGINTGIYDISPCASYTGEYSDWHVPNINEMESMVHAGAADPGAWLNGQGFVNVQSAIYWSSTHATSPTSTNYAWVVNLDTTRVRGRRKSDPRFVWPVRAGQEHFPNPAYPANVPKTGQTISMHPGDDGDLQLGVAWPSTRFTDHGDGTVTDNLTGLMWLKDADCFGARHWYPALDDIAQFNLDPDSFSCGDGEYTADYTDWHLPNRREIHSLFDRRQMIYITRTILPLDHPFVDVQGPIWSSTTIETASNTNGAWGFSVGGAMQGYTKWVYYNHVWPVRGGVFDNPVRDADFDRDGDVDGVDLAILQAAFGSNRDDPNFDERVNLVVDDVIDDADLAAFAAYFGGTNCPCM